MRLIARLAGVAAASCVVLSGCVQSPQRLTAASTNDIPSTWSVPEAAAVSGESALVNWWLGFDDPLLARLIDDALRANTTVNGARAALRQARAARDGTAASLLPAINSSASGQNSFSDPPNSERTSSNNFRAGLDANWELDLFGANRSALNASDASVRASAANIGAAQVSIAAEVALSYIGLRNAQARLTIAKANLAAQQETLQLTLWRQQAGLVTALEAEQARASVEQTSAQLPSLQTAIDQASHALSVLVGRPPAALNPELASVLPVPQAPDLLAINMPAETLRQRADVAASEQQVIAASARVSQAEAARLPSFSLGGSLGLSALTLGALTDGASLAGSLLASVKLPIFDGGARRAQVNAQQAALEQAQITYRAAVLRALQEVEDALVALRGDRERVVHLGAAADAAATSALMARQRYSSGLVDFQTVLDTQRSQLSAQDALSNARADVSSDHVRLYKALGGGWQSEPNMSPDISL